MFAENTEYEILTPSGWKDFEGITFSGKKTTWQIKLSSGAIVNATSEHCFFVNNKKEKLSNLSVNDVIDTIAGKDQIVSITENIQSDVYDIVEVDDILHRYIVNDNIITKNCDEFAFVRNTIARDFWASIIPTLSTGGKAIITSTPNSDEDQFWDIWRGANRNVDEYGNTTDVGQNGFKAFRSYWQEHPDRDEKWGVEQRAKLGDERFEREIECNPIIFDETLINPIVLADLQSQDPIFKQGQIRWFKKPQRGCVYTIALDPSLGTGGDPAAIQVYELPDLIQVAEWRHNKTNIQTQVRLIKEIAEYINDEINNENDIYYSVENNTLGEAALIAISDIGEENIRGSFLSEPRRGAAGVRYRKGFNTTNKSKLLACSKLKTFVEKSKMTIHSAQLISELKTFVSVASSFSAKPGETDDLIMSTLLTIRMVHFLQSFDAELDNKLRDQAEFIEPLPFIMLTA